MRKHEIGRSHSEQKPVVTPKSPQREVCKEENSQELTWHQTGGQGVDKDRKVESQEPNKTGNTKKGCE